MSSTTWKRRPSSSPNARHGPCSRSGSSAVQRPSPTDAATLHTLKTGCLFSAAVGLGLWAAAIPSDEQGEWRAFGDELGLLFQIVDDILDEDGYVREHGPDGARRYADEAAERARTRLAEVDADTTVLRDVVDDLAVRTA